MKHTEHFLNKKAEAILKKSKTCIHCWIEKKKDDFSTDRKHADGKNPICNECRKKEKREYYKNNPRGIRQSVKTWESKNREKSLAHRKVAYLVKIGKIDKPKRCSHCKEENKIEAHHWKGYSEEFAIDVIWLCRKCHKKAHLLSD